jgi:hypothetical protein
MVIGIISAISLIAILFWVKKIYVLNLNILSSLKKISNNLIQRRDLGSSFYTEEKDSQYLDDTSEYTDDFTLPRIRGAIELNPLDDDDSYTE